MSDDRIEAKLLGKQVKHPNKYSPNILVAVPRQINRTQYNISSNDLPFVGYDTWHAYEFSFLTNKGLPVCRILKVVYPHNSEYIVESKSLKLYLNSFNMEHYGNDVNSGLESVLKLISHDLSELLNTNVKVYAHKAYSNAFDFNDYTTIEDSEDVESLQFTAFTESSDLLNTPSQVNEQNSDMEKVYKFSSNLLRSNCKITHQPDWGSVFVYIKTAKNVSPLDLLQYIVSMRGENHFHEEICELIYIRLLEKFKPSKLMVSCLYTRRGGIDICPSRANDETLLPTHLHDLEVLSMPCFRQ